MRKLVNQFPEVLHIWLPAVVCVLVVLYTPNIDAFAAQLDVMPYLQGFFVTLCLVMANNFVVNMAIKLNFKAEWEEYTNSSLEGHSYAPWQFYALWAFLHVMFAVVEALVVL